MSKPPVITIVGTTGVGKSQFSIDLAKAIGGEIINADSMQVYKGLPQITNKHPIEERDGIAHHVMDHVSWTDEYFIHRYAREAHEAIRDIHSRGKIPIVVGGTHYYLSSLLFENKTIAKPKSEVTPQQLEILDGPTETLYATLQSIDPVIAGKFHPRDTRKLRRALEIYYTTGTLASDIYQDQKKGELESSSLRFKTLLFWVYADSSVLQPRLDARVDTMMENGALDEIQQLYNAYQAQEPEPDCTRGIWQVIGFKEFIPYLKGTEKLSLGVEKMKIRTRQYAKSQVKWIRKLLSIELQKEARFDYKNGGKLYVLDATNLDKWSECVAQRGIGIASEFLKGPVSAPQAPEHLQGVLPSQEFIDSFKSNKKMGSEANWTHYTCSHCLDKDGKPLVAVGEDNWEIHLASRRHKKRVQALERKRKHQEIVKKYKKEEIGI